MKPAVNKVYLCDHSGKDAKKVLPTWPENFVNAVVCDPPYELGFMGKKWDSSGIAYSVEMWRDVLRVMKPGAHLLAFGGDRTEHRMKCAIEDAGFEIRTTLGWIFGSGFPKSLNVSAYLDGVRCACVPHSTQTILNSQSDCHPAFRFDDGQPLLGKEADQEFSPSQGDAPGHIHVGHSVDGLEKGSEHSLGHSATGHRASGDSYLPSALQKEGCHGRGSRLSGKASSMSAGQLKAARKKAAGKQHILHSGDGLDSSSGNVNLPYCDECGKVIVPDGLGTALKPAMELICLARKPLSEDTVAANVLRWGTGALNIEAGRIGDEGGTAKGRSDEKSKTSSVGGYLNAKAGQPMDFGRWPANILFDRYAAGILDGKAPDSSRFFYVAKPDGGERNMGLEDKAPVSGGKATGRKEGSAGLNSPRAGAGAGAGAGGKNQNFHPTVKPVDLMSYLIQLVTPRGGVLLDHFFGSGTTGIAAVRLGHPWLGCELDAAHIKLAEARVAAEQAQGRLL